MLKNILVLTIVLGFCYSARALTMNDSQIEKVLITINEGEIDAAKLAIKKTQNDKVKSFAQMMLNDHKKNKSETKKMTKKMLAKSELAETLKKEASISNKALKKVDTSGFDKAYIDQQVTMHETALATLTEKLIPNTKNADLINHLTATKIAVSHHLEEAKNIQTELH